MSYKKKNKTFNNAFYLIRAATVLMYIFFPRNILNCWAYSLTLYERIEEFCIENENLPRNQVKIINNCDTQVD